MIVNMERKGWGERERERERGGGGGRERVTSYTKGCYQLQFTLCALAVNLVC